MRAQMELRDLPRRSGDRSGPRRADMRSDLLFTMYKPHRACPKIRIFRPPGTKILIKKRVCKKSAHKLPTSTDIGGKRAILGSPGHPKIHQKSRKSELRDHPAPVHTILVLFWTARGSQRHPPRPQNDTQMVSQRPLNPGERRKGVI